MLSVDGLSRVGRSLIRVSLAACRPRSLGILVYRLATSIVTRRQSGGRAPKLRSLDKKCVVSLMYEGKNGMVGCKKKSTSWDIFHLSLRHPTIAG